MSILFQKANLSDKSLNLANFNRMVDYLGRLANMTSPNMMIDRNPNGYVLKALPTRSTMSYSDWAFGFSISGAVVTVNSGDVCHGKRGAITLAKTSYTIFADHQYIWVEYSLMTPWTEEVHARILGPSTIKPESDERIFRRWLAQFRLISGVASLEKIGHLGNIEIPGMYA